jgi:hypothetical protein
MNTESQSPQDELVAEWFFQASEGFPAFEVEVTRRDVEDWERRGLVGGERRFDKWLRWTEEHPLAPAQQAAQEAEWDHLFAHYHNACGCELDSAGRGGVHNPRAYFAEALRRGSERVRNANEGERNNTLFRVAASLFEVPTRVGFDGPRAASAAQEVDRALFYAAVAAGLEESEVEATLRSARDAADRQEET